MGRFYGLNDSFVNVDNVIVMWDGDGMNDTPIDQELEPELTTGMKLNFLRRKADITLAQVARRAGYAGPSSVQAYFADDYNGMLSLLVATKLADALEGQGKPPITRDEIYELSEFKTHMSRQPLTESGTYVAYNASVSPHTEADNLASDTLRTPILYSDIGVDVKLQGAGGESLIIETTDIQFEPPVGSTLLPSHIESTRCFIMYAAGNAMEPRYRQGDPLLIGTLRPISKGDDVVILLNTDLREEPDRYSEDRRSLSPAVLATFIQRTSTHVLLEQFNPPLQFRMPAEKVRSINRVIPWHEGLDV